MRQTALFGKTLKDAPKGAYTHAQKLLLRAGYLRDVPGIGIVALPLVERVLRNVAESARGELENAGGAAWRLPAVLPAEAGGTAWPWDRYSGGRDAKEFATVDARGKPATLRAGSATAAAEAMRREVDSYKQLPKLAYDRRRVAVNANPRSRIASPSDFDAVDIHGFALTEEDACDLRNALIVALARVADRIGLDARWVEATTGGAPWEGELLAADDSGPDEALACDSCDYAARVNAAQSRLAEFAQDADVRPMEKVCAPGLIQTGPLAEHLGIPVWKTTKMLLFLADEAPVGVMVRGDCDVSEAKVKARLGCDRLVLAPPIVVGDLTQAEVGYAGPIGLPDHVTILADDWTRSRVNFECGANETDNHLINVNFGRDLPEPEFGDFKAAKAGDSCPQCEAGRLAAVRGWSVAHVCDLGTAPAESTAWTCKDGSGTDRPVRTVSAGLHLSRVVAALAEQHATAANIAWPSPVAPFLVHLIGLNLDDPDVKGGLEAAYARIRAEGLTTLVDDRNTRPGEKFKDSDLLGIPVRLTISRRTRREGKVELKLRGAGEAEFLSLDEAMAKARGR